MSRVTLLAEIGEFVASRLKDLKVYVDSKFSTLTIKGSQITSGTVDKSVLPQASTTSPGIVELSDSYEDRQDKAATASSVSRLVAVVSNVDSDKYYRHSQGLPSNVWTIEHNLNKYPSVTVTDSAKSVVEGQVKYIDSNNLKITFSASFSGYAELN